MQIERTRLDGVLLFTPRRHADERGWFSRTADAATLHRAGIEWSDFVQDSQSRSRRGVVRGLHGRSGGGEAKLVRCAYGALFDVVVDARPTSKTFGRWQGFQLDDVNMCSIYVPRGMLHGFQALTTVADTCYRIDAEHDPAENVTVRWNDAQLGVQWPLPITTLSLGDLTAPSWSDLVGQLDTMGAPTW